MLSRVPKSILLVTAISAAAGLAYVATLSRVGSVGATPAWVALAVTLMGCLPPLGFSSLFTNGAACQLAVVAWRLAALLPSLALLGYWEGAERNCFLICLLACYFVALPLESWLLIREIWETTDS